MERIFDFFVVYILFRFRFIYIENQKNISICKVFLFQKVYFLHFRGVIFTPSRCNFYTLLPN